ncbi:MAG TPA: ComF family protein [Ferruginibacter sp.]|nr:ComF family protein [Ferruginibacter sp.]
MSFLPHLVSDLVHVLYPHTCKGCGSDRLPEQQLLCTHCIRQLPHTGFAFHPNNYIERIFWGRIPIEAGHSEFYFSKGQMVQRLIHQLKYNGQASVGHYLGQKTGNTLLESGRFRSIDGIVALPMFPDKEAKRGYNQANIIARGIAEAMQLPVWEKAIIRRIATETQTRKHRSERWNNVSDSFAIPEPARVGGKHILLVDDVITTGASMEACAQHFLSLPATRISITSIAHA